MNEKENFLNYIIYYIKYVEIFIAGYTLGLKFPV